MPTWVTGPTITRSWCGGPQSSALPAKPTTCRWTGATHPGRFACRHQSRAHEGSTADGPIAYHEALLRASGDRVHCDQVTPNSTIQESRTQQ